jgi:hypothetical protein
VKSSKAEIFSKVHKIPDLQFSDPETQSLTSFSGLVIYQRLFKRIDLRKRLRECFKHLPVSPIYGQHIVVLMLIIHLTLGYRRLRDRDYYKDDPLVKRILGVERLPDVSTVSRNLRNVDDKSIEEVRTVSRDIVLTRLQQEELARITMDFDGSVQSTKRHAEGSAVGFNKVKKGARSYYPLFCTVAQTGQFFDVHHRPGNVHDSNGAVDFSNSCFALIREAAPAIKIETRMDSAFFNEDQIESMDADGIEFTVSVPFERFPELKNMIESRRWWRWLDKEWSFFECRWRPQAWDNRFRFIFVRHVVKEQVKGPLQGHLFEPVSYKYEYKVIVTNKKSSAKKVLQFHNGRGSQEGIFGNAKSHAHLDYVPVKSLNGNKLYLLSAMLTHNLHHEVQMDTKTRERGTTEKRAALWKFEKLSVFRKKILQRAGRLIRPQGRLTLVMANIAAIKTEMLDYMKT